MADEPLPEFFAGEWEINRTSNSNNYPLGARVNITRSDSASGGVAFRLDWIQENKAPRALVGIPYQEGKLAGPGIDPLDQSLHKITILKAGETEKEEIRAEVADDPATPPTARRRRLAGTWGAERPGGTT